MQSGAARDKKTRVRKEVWEEGVGREEEEERWKRHLDHMLCQQQRQRAQSSLGRCEDEGGG